MNLKNPTLLEDHANYWVIFKPSGWFVHAPSDARAQRQFKDFILTTWFYRHLNQKAYPIHRLDFATEGLMIWAKNAESAGVLNLLHQDDRLKKTYLAVVRGQTELKGVISVPLQSDSSPDFVNCVTEFKTLKHLELPVKINSPHSTSRYSLVEVYLKTGRWHQVRRHFNRLSHPIIGDREHGDSHHNRYFRDELKISGLLLKAQKLEFHCPFLNQFRVLESPETEKWKSVNRLFDSVSTETGPGTLE